MKGEKHIIDGIKYVEVEEKVFASCYKCECHFKPSGVCFPKEMGFSCADNGTILKKVKPRWIKKAIKVLKTEDCSKCAHIFNIDCDWEPGDSKNVCTRTIKIREDHIK